MASEEDKIYKVPAEVDINNICQICKKPTKYGIDGFACRVCCKVFHVECVETSDLYTEKEAKMIHRAKTKLGWSCRDCDNVCNLLSPAELEEISTQFENLDVNRDADVSKDEFITFQKREHESFFGTPMDDFEVDLLDFQFKMLDADKSGSIDYNEFMKCQATKKLGRKDKTDLVKILSANEIRAARSMFEFLDKDKDGSVSETEAKDAYRSFYTCLDNLSNKGNQQKADSTGMVKPQTESKALTSHVTMNTDHVMDADDNMDLCVDWKEFLSGQALSIIASRPNKYGIPNEC